MQNIDIDDLIATPSAGLIERVAGWGDVVVLGAGGKIGGGLATMLQRAFSEAGNSSRVHAVSRWSDPQAVKTLEREGVQIVRADVSDPDTLQTIPKTERVINLIGTKFGSSSAPEQAWMVNTVLADTITSYFTGAKISTLSSGNVYPFVPLHSGGADERTAPAPVGEYAMTCLGRERVFEYGAKEKGIEAAIIRLNYACEPRYGVIADIARRVVSGEEIDLSVPAVNVVGQRYANEVIIGALDYASSPAFVLNLAGPETASVHWIANRFAELLDATPNIVGEPSDTSLLNNAALCHSLFGLPDKSLLQLIEDQAQWMKAGGELWDKPTKFERTDGKF